MDELTYSGVPRWLGGRGTIRSRVIWNLIANFLQAGSGAGRVLRMRSKPSRSSPHRLGSLLVYLSFTEKRDRSV